MTTDNDLVEPNLPKTLEEAIQYVIKDVGDQIIKEMSRGATADSISAQMHHGYGRHLRNTFGLWSDSSGDLKESIWASLPKEKQDHFREWWKGKGDHEGRTMHADDASGVIIDAALQRVIQ